MDRWEKASHEATDLALDIMKWGHWLSNTRELLDEIRVDPSPIHAIVSFAVQNPQQVAALAALWDVAVDETGQTYVTATKQFGELIVEAYASRLHAVS